MAQTFSFLVLLVLCCTFYRVAFANVLGIDLASDSLKVALIQPGTPLEIVTNFQSKRKTPTCIAFYKGERLFGSDAYALMGRKPESSFAKVFRMLGRNVDHPLVQEVLKQYFPYTIYANETTGLTTLKVDETQYTPEELIAMILTHVKDMTVAFGGHTVKDCVITVPSSFTQHEREALYIAAEIADLKILSLIEENTAAALHYGVDRVFDEPHNVLFYNMGAGSVQVHVVSYSSYPVKEAGKNKTVGQFEVVGKAWDASLGGFNFDVRLADMLASRFNDVWGKKASGKGKDLRDFVRPMTRLRLEANKVKEVLSANAEYPIRAEQLHADVDLVTKVTRSDFETACQDLFDRLVQPIDAALAMANLTLHDIHAVELLGGAVRMPRVKKTLEEYFKPASLDVGQHLNGDEAMALGAAFRAANLSTSFRVRKVGMTDVSSFGVAVRLNSLPTAAGENVVVVKEDKEQQQEEEEKEKWSKYTPLYARKSALQSKTKTVAFHYDRDIVCQLEYDGQPSTSNTLPAGTDTLIATYNITGIAKFAKDQQEKILAASAAASAAAEDSSSSSSAAASLLPKVHLSFVLDHSGRVTLSKAEVTMEIPLPPTPTPAVVSDSSNSTSNSNSNQNNGTATEAAADAESVNATSTDAAASAASNDTNNNKNNNKKSAPTHTLLRRTLTVSEVTTSPRPPHWTVAQIAEAKSRLKALQAADDARKAKAAAMNDLETYLYKVKNRLVDEEDALSAVSTAEQRQEIVDLCNALEEWLYDEGRDATVGDYHDRQASVAHKADALFLRHQEVGKRRDAVEKARKGFADVRSAVSTWSLTLPHIDDGEKETLLETVALAETWLDEKVQEQEKASPFEQPVFESKQVFAHAIKPVLSAFDKLLKKPKPVPPAPSAAAATDEAAAEEDADKVKSNQADEPAETTKDEPEVIRVKVEDANEESTGKDSKRSEDL